jgi:hypothetical protein
MTSGSGNPIRLEAITAWSSMTTVESCAAEIVSSRVGGSKQIGVRILDGFLGAGIGAALTGRLGVSSHRPHLRLAIELETTDREQDVDSKHEFLLHNSGLARAAIALAVLEHLRAWLLRTI